MGDVLDRWRLNQGWNPWDNTTQEMAIASWCHSLDREQIPFTAYAELYERVLRRRATAISSGRDVPKFGVELLIAEWDGEYGLRNELKRREIDARRTLTGQAKSQCIRCFGTDIETFYDENGVKLGSRPGCKHEYVETGERTTDGMEFAQAAVRPLRRQETAVQICSRIRTELTREFAEQEDIELASVYLAASTTWANAERYCRQNPD